MKYKQLKDFTSSVGEMWRMGGPYQKAANTVFQVIGRVSTGAIDPLVGLRLTKHGESRIPKCVKYDLTGAARLITIHDSGVVLLCFAGDHTACERWLDRNRGSTLVDANGELTGAYESVSVVNEGTRITGPAVYAAGALYTRIPELLFDALVEDLPRGVVRALESLEAVNTEDEIFKIAQCISDVDTSAATYDVFALLRKDRVEEAIKRIKIHNGEYEKLENLSPEQVAALADSDIIKTIPSDNPHFQQIFEHFVKSASYMDWMLFLHPDQADKIEQDFDGPAKLVGVSGSGKTCIVVKRSIHLAEKYPTERVLILTLNRPLARLIRDLVDSASLPAIKDQIDVLPFFDLCRQLLHKYEPQHDKLYDDTTWKSHEHIDEIWREYYRCELNNKDAFVIIPIHDSLIFRKVDAESYIREEFDWIRSAVPPTERMKYLDLPRSGRSMPFEKHFREQLIEGLAFWERKMREIGVSDYLGLTNALFSHIDNLQPRYRCILVDESQDFGTTELSIIRKLVGDSPNNLFFCGDAAQQVSAKHQSFLQAGIVIPGARSFAIRKNYRNSREILGAAYAILEENISEDLIASEDFELLDPEYANFSSSTPLLLDADGLDQEVAFALALLRSETQGGDAKKGCLVFCGYSLHELNFFSRTVGLPLLDGTITIERDNVYLSDLEQTKGFEFDIVCIVNCSKNVLPEPTKPTREQFRDLSRFYVAMTRAKNQLVLSYSEERSILLKNVDKHFLSARWSEYLPQEPACSIGIPPRLDQIRRHSEDKEQSLSKMTGAEFLYTQHAIGLEQPLIAKIRELVSGRSRIFQGTPVEWRNMGVAAADLELFPRARQTFGPETSRLFMELSKKLNLGLP